MQLIFTLFFFFFFFYQAAVDHCQVNVFQLEEALSLELQGMNHAPFFLKSHSFCLHCVGEFLMRRGARRAARSLIQEAMMVYASMSASGKVTQLTEKHEWLLKTASTSRTADMGCQTEDTTGLDVIGAAHADEAQNRHAVHPEDGEQGEQWIKQSGLISGHAGQDSLEISRVGLGELLLFRLLLLLPTNICRYH